MPKINVAVPEINESVFRPVVLSVIDQIYELTKMSKKSRLYWPGDSNTAITPGSSEGSTEERFARFDDGSYNYIQVEEKIDETSMQNMSILHNSNDFIFNDKLLQLSVKPVFAFSNVTVNFKYNCGSRSEAERWYNDTLMRISHGANINLHSVNYAYFIPMEIMAIIQTAYWMRENVEGYGDTFQDYFRSRSTERLSLKSDLVGKNARLMINEQEDRIQGLYDFETIPDKPVKEENGYSIGFGYRFSFRKVIGCQLEFPVIVHNQVMPSNIIKLAWKPRPENNQPRLSAAMRSMYSIETMNYLDRLSDSKYIIRIPEFDQFSFTKTPDGLATLMLFLCTLNENDNRYLLNLNELGDYALDEDILQFIRESEYPYMGEVFQSIFLLSVFEDRTLTTSKAVTLDSNLNVNCTYDLSRRRQNRLKLSIVTDLTRLSADAINRLRKYPKALIKIIAIINEALKNHLDFNKMFYKNQISMKDFNTIALLLNGRLSGYDEFISRVNPSNPKSVFYGYAMSSLMNLYNETRRRKTTMNTGVIVRR